MFRRKPLGATDEEKIVILSLIGRRIQTGILFLALLLTACTDYVSQIEDRYGEWETSSVAQGVVDPSTVVKGKMTDERDGQTYKTVIIGTQVWMAENLNYETANSYCYGDKPSNCSKYGRLYTWAAAMDSVGTWSTNGKGCGYGKTCSPTYPVRGACPIGWHLPTQTEWNTLFTAVGGSSTAGTKLKSTSGWISSGNGTDAYSFSALPAGFRDFNGGYHEKGNDAYFRSSTENISGDAYNMYLSYSYSYGGSFHSGCEFYGFSVRCVKDKGDVPALSSSSVTSGSSVAQGVVDPSTVVKGKMTDERDGQTYKTVIIGSQTWMAENLNYETANSYCYDDTSSNCSEYGRLYTWAAAMDSVGTWSTNGKGCGYNKTCTPIYPVRGVCPTGWHLPTKAEFETLFTAVGGFGTAGTKLKSTTGWNSSGNGTDAYSFSALPAGGGDLNGGYYYNEGNYAVFWSSTEYDSDYAYYVYLHYYYYDANLSGDTKNGVISVRCIKD